MFRRMPLWLVAALIPLDFAAVICAGVAAWLLRFHPLVQALRPVIFRLSFADYFSLVILAATLNTVIIAVLGLYKFRQEISMLSTMTRLVLACFVTFAAITSAIFIRQELFDSRFLVITGWLLAIIFLLTERSLINLVIALGGSKLGLPTIKILLVGHDHISEKIKQILDDNSSLGMRVVKSINSPDISEISTYLERGGVIEEILLSDPSYPKEDVVDLIEFAHDQHIRFSFVPNLFQTLTANATGAVIGGIPVVELRRTPLEGWGRISKRILDIIGSMVAIIVFSPFMAAIAIAIKLDSEGPVLYRSKRFGPKREFIMLKFRTMKIEYCTGDDYPYSKQAEQLESSLIEKHNIRQGPVPKVLNDPRRTRLGRFLERTSLDELPQFFNSLKGDISLVGPRPHLQKEVAHYEKVHKRVFAVKPGITGMAQIAGRSDLNFDDEVRLDLYYIENWSLWLDLIIIFKTPFVILFRRHKS